MSTKKLKQKSSKPFTNPFLSKIFQESVPPLGGIGRVKSRSTSNLLPLKLVCSRFSKNNKYLNKFYLLLLLIVPVFPTLAQEQSLDCKEELWSQKSETIATEIGKKEIAIPSLWWAKKHYDPFGGKLISNWLAYPAENRIDLIVNRQLWSSMDYLSRYRFVNQFGMVTREYGYSLRVVNQEQKCLATYYYDASINPPKWEINLDTNGQSSLQLD